MSMTDKPGPDDNIIEEAGLRIGESRWRSVDRELVQLRADNLALRNTVATIEGIHRERTRPTIGGGQECAECHRPWPCKSAEVVSWLRSAPATKGGI